MRKFLLLKKLLILLIHFGNMKQRVSLILQVCCLLLIDSCIIVKSSRLTYYKQLNPEQSNKLRLDGYYYHTVTKPQLEGDYIRGFYLYKDGTVKGTTGGLYKPDAFIDILSENSEYSINDVSAWGAYIIEDDIIKIQQFYVAHMGGFGGTWDVIEDKGKIVNDSTLLFLSKTKEVVNLKFITISSIIFLNQILLTD